MNLYPVILPLIVSAVGTFKDAPRRDRREKSPERSGAESFARKLHQAVEQSVGSRINVKA